MKPFKVILLGNPKPKPRPRLVRRGGFTRAYSPKTETQDYWTMQLKRLAPEQPFDKPLRVTVCFFIERKKTVKRELPTSNADGDIDNLFKTLDICNGLLWVDDRLIVELHARKEYADMCDPHVVIQVDEI